MRGVSRPRCSIKGCKGEHRARGLCYLHYQRFMNTGTTDPPQSKFDDGRSMQEHLVERMMSGLKKLPNGCWISTRSYLHVNGYAFVVIDRRPGKGLFRERVHRLSYKHFKGPIPHGIMVCHKCDNRPCFNPAHLFLGTQHENLLDMARKGRRAGERSAQAKLTEKDIFAIRKAYGEGAFQRELAEKYGVTQTAISMIVLGKRWGWLRKQRGSRETA
jgi:hypothetical protein